MTNYTAEIKQILRDTQDAPKLGIAAAVESRTVQALHALILRAEAEAEIELVKEQVKILSRDTSRDGWVMDWLKDTIKSLKAAERARLHELEGKK